MKKILVVSLFLFVAQFSNASFGNASAVEPHIAPIYYAPINYGYWNGFPYATGFWGWNYPVVVGNPWWYGGYSYYPYYYYPTYVASYGAIAYSVKTDKVGYSYGQDSQNMAADNAVRGCNAEDCAGVVWVQGGCAVVTTSKTAQRLDWAYSYDRLHAKQLAMQACRRSQAKDCETRAWICAW